MPSPDRSPREEYAARLDGARRSEAEADRVASRFADSRLLVFLAALIVAGLSLGRSLISSWWIALPVALFAALVVLHDRATKRRDRARDIAAIYERGLARIEDRWMDTGRDGGRLLDPSHPYAADMDLLGKGSLFHRISTAETGAGERMLARWLLAPADPETIRLRQQAVAELAPMLDFREGLICVGEGVGRALDADALASWAVRAESLSLGPLRGLTLAMAAMATVAVAVVLSLDIDARWLIVPFAIEGLYAMALAGPVGRILEHVDRTSDDFGRLGAILARIEAQEFGSPLLTSLKDGLMHAGHPASSDIAGVRRLVDRLEWGRNLVFLPFALAWLWRTQVALAVEAWRRRQGGRVASWVEAVAEFEALASFAAFSYENPDDPFPEIVEAESPLVEATRLGHPLLPRATMVRNDFRLGGDLRVLVISGSNMSGKSTFLRSVGTNAVLALAGATVRAGSMRITPVAIGATLRVQDSLQGGTSRFYAEILRIRQVVDLTRGALPLLFLLDEVLHGTNSHDRLSGATAVVRGLIDRGAIGLVTTHDLALAEVAEGLAPRAANVHFEDHLEDGVMRFDYVMRPGVVRKSNALALMRAVGLEV